MGLIDTILDAVMGCCCTKKCCGASKAMIGVYNKSGGLSVVPAAMSFNNNDADFSTNNDVVSKGTKSSKVLLLGAAESGKSTIVKQLKILHENGFTKSELDRYKDLVRLFTLDNLVRCLTTMDLDKEVTSRWKNHFRDLIIQVNFIHGQRQQRVDESTVGLAKRLWADDVVAQRFAAMGEQDFDENVHFFLSMFDRIMGDDYVPSHEDILSVRVPTTGIVDVWFRIGRLNVNLIDVGGQRSERKKWLHCFSSVNAVIFVVALSEYNLVLNEDNTVNRMHESLKLFASVCNVKWFLHAAMVLFMNKKDLFEEKIKSVSLRGCFPEYKGLDYDFQKGIEYVAGQFASKNVHDREVYRHYTCAKDGGNIRAVFQTVTDMLQRAMIKGLGLY